MNNKSRGLRAGIGEVKAMEIDDKFTKKVIIGKGDFDKYTHFKCIPLMTLKEAKETVNKYNKDLLSYRDNMDEDTLGTIEQDEGGVWFCAYEERFIEENFKEFIIR